MAHEDIYEPCDFCGHHCPGWTTLTRDPLGPENMAYWICTDCWAKRDQDRQALDNILEEANKEIP